MATTRRRRATKVARKAPVRRKVQRKMLTALGKRFRTMKAKMKFLRSLKRR